MQAGEKIEVNASAEQPIEGKWNQDEEVQRFIDMGPKGQAYLAKGYNAVQLREIRQGMTVNINVENWIQSGYDWMQIDEIIKGIQAGVDIKGFANMKYQSLQMEQIRLGLQSKLDISVYANPQYDHKVMREIRLAMMMQMNIMDGVKKGYSGDILREYRLSKLDNVNLVPYIEDGYEEDQLEEIRLALKQNLDLSKYLSKDLFGTQINQIRLGLESNVDVSIFGSTDYSWLQMREIRIGLEEHLNTSLYQKKEFSWEQMKQIRMGLEQYLKVDSYANIRYSAKEMEEKRLILLEKDQEERSNNEIFSGENPESEEIDDLIANLKDGGLPVDIGIGVMTIAEDEMSVKLKLNEKTDGEYKDNKIVQVLNDNGITHGIEFQRIGEMIRNREYNEGICVAKGKIPEDGQDGYFEYFFKTQAEKGPKVLPDGTVDYYEMGNIENVQEGQKLAQYHKATMGVYGYTVKGKLLSPSKRGKEQLPLKGKGVTLSEDRMTYTSQMTGQVSLRHGNFLEVCSVLTIQGNVDLTSGNIFFAGDVEIRGDILTGFRVVAGRNLKVNGHIESAYVKAGGDIMVRGGMNGNGIGRIESGGDISGNFFDNTVLNVKGNLKANYLNSCQVRCEGKVSISGAKGVILGGNTRAVKGVDSFYIGNNMETPTLISIGAGPEVMAQYVDIKQREKKLIEEVSVLQKGLTEYRNRSLTEDSGNRKMYLKLVQALEVKKKENELTTQKKQELEEIVKVGKDSQLSVNGYLYPGTRIVAGVHTLHVTEKQCSVILTDGEDQIMVARGR